LVRSQDLENNQAQKSRHQASSPWMKKQAVVCCVQCTANGGMRIPRYPGIQETHIW